MIHIYRKVYGAPVSRSFIYVFDYYAGSGTFHWFDHKNILAWSGEITTGAPNKYRVQINTWAPHDSDYRGWANNYDVFHLYR